MPKAWAEARDTNMTEPRQDIIKLLKEAAVAYLPILEKQVQPRLNDREQRLLDWLMAQYGDEANRRWYDPVHILYSTNFALDLIAAEGLDRLIVSGIILHDIGYFAIPDKSWSSPQSRMTHMQEGAALAARILAENDFSPAELEKVVGMIAVHDNPYLGIAITGKDRLGLRDCDRVWVMHLLSFCKDVAAKPDRFDQPREFLHDRLTQFYGKDQPFGEAWHVTENQFNKNTARIEPPTYDLTRRKIEQQFTQRMQELQDDTLLSSADKFKTLLLGQIEHE
jgi:hypothetical protein